MDYEVILSAEAQEHFRKIIHYLLNDLKSEQAAINVIDDMEETISKLSQVAGSLKLCEHPRLRALKYRTIHFKKHKYFMLYKTIGNEAHVLAIFHDLQDYENICR